MWKKQKPLDYVHPQHPQQPMHHHGMVGADERAHQLSQHHHQSSAMGEPSSSNSRTLRNKAEKQRRDNLNNNISMMGELVPAVAKSPRKMRKISILRLAAAFLRTYHTLGRGIVDFLPPELSELVLEQVIDNLVGTWGFLIVFTTAGKIVYVSRTLKDHLGHTQLDLVGQSIEDFIHPDDRRILMKNLTLDDMQITDVTNDSSNSSADSSPRNEEIPFREQRRNFELRMLRYTASSQERVQYEYLEISGLLRLADACRNPDSNATRMKHRGVNYSSNDIIFVGVAKLLAKRPITALSILDANKSEYITRHLVDGRIVYCDHRVAVVTGYFSEEVSGESAFGFMHVDDYKWPITGLCQMYDRAENCGTSCYRLRTKTGEFIYLRTHGYLEYDEKRTVVSYVCINTLVSKEEGVQLIQQMKERYSTGISEGTRNMIESTAKAAHLDVASNPRNMSWAKSKRGEVPKIQLEEDLDYLVKHLTPNPSKNPMASSPVHSVHGSSSVIVSSHLPHADVQDSNVGNCIDNYVEEIIPKQEPKTSRRRAHSTKKQGSCRSPRKMLAIEHLQRIHDGGAQEAQNPTTISERITNVIAMSSPTIQEVTETNHLDIPQDILNADAVDSSALCKSPCDIKVEHSLDAFKLQDGEAMIEYLKNTQQNPLKRIYRDDDLRPTSNKKRHNSVSCLPTDANEKEQSVSYDCGPSVEEFLELPTDFSQYDINSQPSNIAESSSSTLNTDNINYQVDSSGPFLPLNTEYTDTDFVTKNVSIFEINDALNDELKKLENSMALQASEINVLAQYMDNPALQSKRERVTRLEVERNKQKHILETLQQDHRNIIIIKRNIDV